MADFNDLDLTQYTPAESDDIREADLDLVLLMMSSDADAPGQINMDNITTGTDLGV